MAGFIKQFKETRISDIPEVGGKNASLGEIYTQLTSKGIAVPNGFAVTAFSFREFIKLNHLGGQHSALLAGLNRNDYSNLREIGSKARELIMNSRMPFDLEDAIIHAYRELSDQAGPEVAVRSSATAEDLPEASFAGLHDSFLNIKGEVALIESIKKCFASLYNDRAIKYREDNHFDHSKVEISVGVQSMVNTNTGCSGIGFTLEPESGFRNVIHLSGVWGLGEVIVQGQAIPDDFILFKPSLKNNKSAIIQKRLGAKAKMMIYGKGEGHATDTQDTPETLREQYVLNDEEITALGRWAVLIEDHYQKPMDIEWAKDGNSGKLFILQARPETVHSREKANILKEYQLSEAGEVLAEGEAIGNKIVAGRARILSSPAESDKLEEGDIIVTDTVSPDWDPVLKKVGGIVTNKGGRTSHASIIARELGVAAIVGTGNAVDRIDDGEFVTVSCGEGSTGRVYRNRLKWKEILHDFSKVHLPDHPGLMLILGEPERAFELSFYPNSGIGLMRIEFIISNYVRVHPMALVKFNELKDEKAKAVIETLSHNYPSKEQFFIEKLAEGVGTIAAAFYPKEVIVRMSDFKTNEYANLIGGQQFEPKEENPMIGFRGASRYYHELYKEGFGLECKAMKRVRDDMGLTNVKLMIPFCRTPEEGRRVIEVMSSFGLKQKENNLEIYMMAEVPSNVILVDEFAKIFDGFSIGSNDLTQLLLGIDRDSSVIQHLFDEENDASKIFIKTLIDKAIVLNRKVGICGQAPSDSTEFASFLVDAGIDTISFNHDALLAGIENINKIIPMKQECSPELYESKVDPAAKAGVQVTTKDYPANY